MLTTTERWFWAFGWLGAALGVELFFFDADMPWTWLVELNGVLWVCAALWGRKP